MLLLIALFVWMGAHQESATLGLKLALSGVPIASAMRTAFRTLSPVDPLSSAIQLIVAGVQQDFPVVDGKRLVGVLTRSDVVRALSVSGADAAVESVMHRGAETAHPGDMLDAVLPRLQRPEAAPIIVVKNDGVVGILAVENITAFIAMHGVRHTAVAPSGRHA
jgi:CBS domain-containing protein